MVFRSIFLLLLVHNVHGAQVRRRTQGNAFGRLPAIGLLIESAFPTWCMNDVEDRLTGIETCADGTPNGRFSPLYFTFKHSGGDPALGGYPTNIDIHYAFEFAAPYFGQACAGGSHLCNETFDGTTMNCQVCPKVNTDSDYGMYGPGHVPPHISLAAVTRAYEQGDGGDIADWFNFDQNACRILPTALLKLIRLYYPREADGSVYYPPPFSELGGNYPLEFVNLAGESCEAEKAKHPDAGPLICFEQHTGDVSQYPDYLEAGHGSPHYCSKEAWNADANKDWCPYIFFGPNRGKYCHPHIAYASLETYLANKVMPDMCNTTWDDSNYPAMPDTTRAYPQMQGGYPDVESMGVSGLEAPEQPAVVDGKWIWPGPEGTMRKPVKGLFATDFYIVEGYTPDLPDCTAQVEKQGET